MSAAAVPGRMRPAGLSKAGFEGIQGETSCTS